MTVALQNVSNQITMMSEQKALEVDEKSVIACDVVPTASIDSDPDTKNEHTSNFSPKSSPKQSADKTQ